MTPSEIKTATLRFAAQCLNQLRYQQRAPCKKGAIIQRHVVLLVKLNVGLLWLKLHSTRRGIFLLAHWTWN
jgi:hypothetical protein